MANMNGKRPLSQKKLNTPTPINMDDIFGNALGLDPEVEKELREKSLAYRFISAPDLQKMGGYHKHGWKPYKRESGKIGSDTIQFGSDPDGYIRRGELVLAVRPVELNEKHKAYLRQEAAKGKLLAQTQARELKEIVREAQGTMQVHEGYEDEGEEEKEQE